MLPENWASTKMRAASCSCSVKVRANDTEYVVVGFLGLHYRLKASVSVQAHQ